jgi:hypothetical protein
MAKARCIFPPHIPGICHPNVNSMASLIQDLDEDSSAQSQTKEATLSIGNNKNSNNNKNSHPDDHINNACNNSSNISISQDELQSLQKKSESYKKVTKLGKHCEPFLHHSNLHLLQIESIKSDIETYKEDSQYTKGKIAELNALSKLSSLNYKYCISSQSCPERMEVLNRCYSRFNRDIVQALAKAGGTDYICNKEKKAVERCVGGLVMNVTRDSCQD